MASRHSGQWKPREVVPALAPPLALHVLVIVLLHGRLPRQLGKALRSQLDVAEELRRLPLLQVVVAGAAQLDLAVQLPLLVVGREVLDDLLATGAAQLRLTVRLVDLEAERAHDLPLRRVQPLLGPPGAALVAAHTGQAGAAGRPLRRVAVANVVYVARPVGVHPLHLGHVGGLRPLGHAERVVRRGRGGVARSDRCDDQVHALEDPGLGILGVEMGGVEGLAPLYDV
eukprot:scaffold35278_cov48-Phaeocystis_antarctica.AAC.2